MRPNLTPDPRPLGADPRALVDEDLQALAEQMRRCLRGRWFTLCCQAERLRAFALPRVMCCALSCSAVVWLGMSSLPG